MRLHKLLLALIILLAIFFRFNNLNWDSNQHLHPDERFLTMVGGAMKFPNSLIDYFNPQSSTLNPTNIGYKFYVYGAFPVVLNKFFAVLLDNDNYNLFTIQGRFLSALADLFVVFLVFKTVELFEKKYKLNKSIKYWSAFFYAIAVFPIQQAHFFTADSLLNLFAFASFYFALKFSFKPPGLIWLVLSAVFFGLAMASKVSAIYILPLNLILMSLSLRVRSNIGRSNPVKPGSTLLGLPRFATQSVALLAMTMAVTYLTLRLANPYYFESANLFNPTLNHEFVSSIKSLESFNQPGAWLPPMVQWINKTPVIFSLNNLILYGVGIPYFISLLLGIYFILRKYRSIEFILIIFWVFGYFLYQSVQYVKVMRYFILIYPFLAIFAGFGAFYILSLRSAKNFIFRRRSNPSKVEPGLTGLLRSLSFVRNDIFLLLLVSILLLWSLAFSSIYFHKHSRVEASEWIYKNIPNNSLILSEYWDDPLPLLVKNTYGKNFRGEALPVFDPDTPEKWQKMNALLSKADYYILSSNRGWGSITTVPDRYPMMSKFYQDLFASSCHPERSTSRRRAEGSYCYKKIKEFTSYPSLKYLGIPIDFPDDLSDESFTVYDHPKVIIFKKK